jgi:hypothetical protein
LNFDWLVAHRCLDGLALHVLSDLFDKSEGKESQLVKVEAGADHSLLLAPVKDFSCE